MSDIRDRYLEAYGTEELAAEALAADLMEGDPASFKQGYSLGNALLAAQGVFKDVDWKRIRERLSETSGVGYPD